MTRKLETYTSIRSLNPAGAAPSALGRAAVGLSQLGKRVGDSARGGAVRDQQAQQYPGLVRVDEAAVDQASLLQIALGADCAVSGGEDGARASPRGQDHG